MDLDGEELDCYRISCSFSLSGVYFTSNLSFLSFPSDELGLSYFDPSCFYSVNPISWIGFNPWDPFCYWPSSVPNYSSSISLLIYAVSYWFTIWPSYPNDYISGLVILSLSYPVSDGFTGELSGPMSCSIIIWSESWSSFSMVLNSFTSAPISTSCPSSSPILTVRDLMMISYLLIFLLAASNRIISSFTDFYSFTFAVFLMVLALAPNLQVEIVSLSL